MRVLLISSTFPPRKFGGITESSYLLAKQLVDRGHQVTVYTTDIKDRCSRISDITGVKNVDGMHVHYFRNLSNRLAFMRIYLPLGMIGIIKRELKNFDIIHLNEFRSFQSIIVHYYAKKYNIPYVLQTRGSLPRFVGKKMLKHVYDKLWGYMILKDAAKLIALTPMEAQQYESWGVNKGRIGIVPNAIELSEFDKLPQRGNFREKWNISKSQKMVLSLSRINRIKGLDLLVKAFNELQKEIDNVKLVIVGPDDGYLPNLRELIRELKIEEKILYIDLLQGRNKLEAYVDADIYVLPSSYEIFGRTILEAMACGTPVVVTESCGLASIVHEQTGIVITSDKEQLSDALSHMLSDEQMRLQFGERGKSLVREKFNQDKTIEQIEKIYGSCMSSKQ